jgi:uncharacterized YigZ family protein
LILSTRHAKGRFNIAFLRLIKAGHAEQTINKSRFIALAASCADERSVAQMLRAMATQYHNASHLAYAFRIKTPQGIVQRFSDAGEPSGTAGKPILQLLEGRDLINVAVGVIRYYGGINLGTGGLARAYGGTAKLALDDAGSAEFVQMQTVQMHLAFKQWELFKRELEKIGGQVLQQLFAEDVAVVAELPESQVEGLLKRFSSDFS